MAKKVTKLQLRLKKSNLELQFLELQLLLINLIGTTDARVACSFVLTGPFFD